MKLASVGASLLVSFVILVGIMLFATFIVLEGLIPVYEKIQESTLLNEAFDNMRSIDKNINEVLAEGKGAARRVPLTINEGEYIIDAEHDRIEFAMITKRKIIEYGIHLEREGITILSGATAKLTTNFTHFILANDWLKITLRNTSDSLFNIIREIEFVGLPPITFANSSLIFDFNISLSLDEITTKPVRMGSKLAKAEVIFQSGENSVSFILPSYADGILLKPRGKFKSLTLGLAFHIADDNMNDIIHLPNISSGNISVLGAGCWDSAALSFFMICSHDNVEVTPSLALSLVHSGIRAKFDQLCWSNYTLNDYQFNLTTKEKIFLGVTNLVCDLIEQTLMVDEYEQKIPPTLTMLPAPREMRGYEIILTLDYENIDLVEGGILRKGTRYACLRYLRVENMKPVIEILPC
jgi:hypothetical protein